jgi:hypothetical protein
MLIQLPSQEGDRAKVKEQVKQFLEWYSLNAVGKSPLALFISNDIIY